MTIIDKHIRTRPNPDCHVCGTGGKPLYQSMHDRLFGVPGEWNLKKCSNQKCRLVWLDPMPIEEDIGKAYQIYFTHEADTQGNVVHGKRDLYLRRLFKYFKHGYLATRYGYNNDVSVLQKVLGYVLYAYPLLPNILSRGVRYVKYMPQGKLLDVGCGDGSYIQYMQKLGWDVKGIDFDPKALKNAQAKGLLVELGDLSQQQYPESTFDVITINHVIEHVTDPIGLLQESRRILKPGGTLMVATPNASSWGHRFFKSCWVHLDPPRHLHIFTLPSLVHALEQAGLQVIKYHTSARSSGEILVSRSICKTGVAELRHRHSLTIRVWARIMDIFERFLIMVKKNTGQELVVIASKEKGI